MGKPGLCHAAGHHGQRDLTDAAHERRVHHLMPIRILAILLCCGLWAAIAQETLFPDYPGPEKIQVITTSADEARSFLQFAAQSSREVDRLLRPSAMPTQLLLFRLGDSRPANLQTAEIFLDRSRPSAALGCQILEELIMRRVCEKREKNLATLPAVHWLAAALCNRIYIDGKGIRSIYNPDYRIAHTLYNNAHFPQLKNLLTMPVTAEHIPFFRLYMQHCDLLTRILENLSTTNSLISQQLEMEAYGREPLPTLEFLLRQAGIEFQNIQYWYEHAVLQESARYRQRNEAEAVATQLRDLTTVTLLEAGSTEAIRHVPITDIPRLIEDYRMNARMLEQTQKKIQELRLNAPIILHEALTLYLDALELLKKNKIRRFKKQFAEAEQAFVAAMQRQKQIEILLDRIERERKPPLENFQIFFDVLKRYDSLFPCPGLPTTPAETIPDPF